MLRGKVAFDLYQSYGFPIELTKEIAQEKNIYVDEKGFAEEMSKHQNLSRFGSAQKFKGGLSDGGEITTMLHTATHIMLAGLRKYLGDDVHQAGSNITAERTRFDFTHPQKVGRDVLDQVETYVNNAISEKCNVLVEEMKKEVAREMGVEGSFWDKYPDMVTIYTVKSDNGTLYSRELCGGPHVKNTGDIKGVFKIKKEEASSAGVRRIKAVLV
jgi:alanyl-tRNA synthetase